MRRSDRVIHKGYNQSLPIGIPQPSARLRREWLMVSQEDKAKLTRKFERGMSLRNRKKFLGSFELSGRHGPRRLPRRASSDQVGRSIFGNHDLLAGEIGTQNLHREVILSSFRICKVLEALMLPVGCVITSQQHINLIVSTTL